MTAITCLRSARYLFCEGIAPLNTSGRYRGGLSALTKTDLTVPRRIALVEGSTYRARLITVSEEATRALGHASASLMVPAVTNSHPSRKPKFTLCPRLVNYAPLTFREQRRLGGGGAKTEPPAVDPTQADMIGSKDTSAPTRFKGNLPHTWVERVNGPPPEAVNP